MCHRRPVKWENTSGMYTLVAYRHMGVIGGKNKVNTYSPGGPIHNPFAVRLLFTIRCGCRTPPFFLPSQVGRLLSQSAVLQHDGACSGPGQVEVECTMQGKQHFVTRANPWEEPITLTKATFPPIIAAILVRFPPRNHWHSRR